MNLKIKLFFAAFIMSMAIFVVTPVFAVDTVEPFTVGAFTDFEGYYSFNYGIGGQNHGLEFLAGGGMTDKASYFLTFGMTNIGSTIQIDGVGFGFIWNFVEIEKFSMDLIPAFTFAANRQKNKLVYPGFDAFTFSANFEFNFTFIKAFQPYLLAGFEGTYDDKSKEFDFVFPLSLGAMIFVKEDVEFFMQLGWSPAKENVWGGSERTVSSGLNIRATQNLEIITEIGWNFNAEELAMSVGLIYAI